jgi:hypothetical protein
VRAVNRATVYGASMMNGAARLAGTCDTCGGASERRVDERPVVTVFGAGIAGLSAAHELVERNFIVQIVEPTEHRTREGECEVGGIAATQYGELLRRATAGFGNGAGGAASDGTGVLGQGGALSAGMRPVPAAVNVPQRIWFAFAGTADDVRYEPELGFQALRPRDRPVRGTTGGVLAIANDEKIERIVETLATLCESHPDEQPVVEVRGHVEDSLPGEAARAISLREAELVCGVLRAHPRLPSRLVLQPVGLGSAEPAGDNRYEEGRRRNNRVELRVRSVLIPGDHGYRFFPAFYWNLDDTMQRTPLFRDGEETGGTTLDHLKSASVVSLDFADGRSAIDLPRRRIRSFEEMRRLIADLQTPLGYTSRDVALYQLKMFEFMTTGRRRRRHGAPDGMGGQNSLEDVSWYEYVTGSNPEDARLGAAHPPFSAAFLRDLNAMPKAMAGMSGTESDAHTSGNIHLQLVLDQVGDGSRVDRLLDGPTSEQWFDHWKLYLRHQGVRFFVGAFDGFDWCAVCAELRPRVAGVRYGKRVEGAAPFPSPVFEDEVEAEMATDPAHEYRHDADFFVLAAPLHVAKAAARRFDAANGGVLEGALADLVSYDVGDAYEKRSGPPTRGQLRDMTGLQYYFENDFTFARGHTFYVQSAWSLTSISQLQFWRDRRTSASGYLGILSVDLGEMHKVDDSESILAALLAADTADRLERFLDARAGLENPSDPLVDGMAELARRCADGAWRVARKASAVVRERADDEPRWRNLHAALGKLLTERFDAESGETIESLLATAREATAARPARFSTSLRAAAAWLEDASLRADTAGASVYAEYVSSWREAVALALDALAESHAFEHGTDEDDDPLAFGVRALREAARYVYDAAAHSLAGKTAWSSTRQEIAETVWRQIKTCLDPRSAASIPEPLWYRLDDYIEFGALPSDPARPADVPVRNRAPYHITGVGGFDKRPGVLPGEEAPFYEVANKRWLLVGNYVKTYTRIATMEQSNESARHAVRAIIDKILRSDAAKKLYRAAGRRLGDLPRFYDPEEHELDDFAFLRRVDDLLYEDGLPHMVEIVKLRQSMLEWMPSESGEHPIARLADVLGAVQQQAREDFGYLLDPLDRAGRPVRELVERLIAAAVRP